MRKLLQRILRGYREHPIRGLFYAFLIYMVIAVALVLLSPYIPDSTPGELTSSESYYGISLTIVVASACILFSGWFVPDK